MKKKLDVDIRPYKILGACNPSFAYKALQAESHIGIYLPCNIIVQDVGDGKTDVAAVDPLVAMSRVENPALESVAKEVQANTAACDQKSVKGDKNKRSRDVISARPFVYVLANHQHV